MPERKKVLLVVIDALASRVLLPALDQGRLPTFRQLADRGVLREECLSVFPSITPAATAAIVTGAYPIDHGIAGGFWYDRENDSVAYFGDDFWVVIDKGMGDFFNDFLVQLNSDRLQVPTIYERVEQQGLTAAALNFIWFRGDTRHEVDAPLLFKLLPTISVAPQVCGPRVLALADFAASRIPGKDDRLRSEGGVFRRFGFHDETTAEFLQQLNKAEPFPDFTLAYFPNNDFVSHAEGPQKALSALEQVDQHLSRFIDERGGMDEFLAEFAILITGDHSQSDLCNDSERRGIDLGALLCDHRIAAAGCIWSENDELMVCPNMRACHIYIKEQTSAARDAVVERLLSDDRVDQVLWRSDAWDNVGPVGTVRPEQDTFVVATARGRLRFHRTERAANSQGTDAYANHWCWEGDLTCVDARVEADRNLVYGEYPNALERIAHGFCRQADDLWVTARVGYELEVTETSVHTGGSHGALNRDDSTAPLIVAGHSPAIEIPAIPRTIDVAPICLQTLGLHDEARQLVNSRHAGRGF